MCRLFLVLILFSNLLILKTHCARILCVFPTPSFSHQIVYRVLTQELAKRGHEVVVITTHPAFKPGEAPSNLTEIDVHETQEIWFTGVKKAFNAKSNQFNLNKMYLRMFTNIFEKQLQTKQVRGLLQNKRDHFDLLMLESDVVATLGLAHIFNAPVIQTSTFGPMAGTYSLFGTAIQPLLYPIAVQLKTYNLTVLESLNNLYRSAVSDYVFYGHESEENEMLQRNLGSDIPPLKELFEKVVMYVQSVYPIWMSNPPVPHNIIYLGGLHQKSSKDLPKDLQDFLDSSKNGVIYVSFGTNVNPALLSSEKVAMMTRVFATQPYDVLWKRDEPVGIETENRIRTAEWFPQSDLLYHPKIKLFITQGGLQSTEEAITAGVPLIGIPIFGDQWRNTEKYVHHGIGLQLDWNTLSYDELATGIKTVIEHESYKENVMRLRNIFIDQPLPAVERAIWWTEYALRHGGSRHLFPASANMPWTQYFEVELCLLVLTAALSALGTVSFVVLRSARWLCNRTNRRHVKRY